MKSTITFNPHSSQERRALQAWQILISQAMNRQTITYKSLSILMFGNQASGVLGGILGHIAFYCNEYELPPLTAIVVNSTTGLPGDEIPISLDLNVVREDVYNFDWFNVYPPTEKELKDANINKRFK